MTTNETKPDKTKPDKTNPEQTDETKTAPRQTGQTRRRRKRRKTARRALRFSPYAWAKLLFLRDCGDTEVGAFGITPSDDLLYVEDLVTVRQKTTVASVDFDDQAVADFFDAQVDVGRMPEEFARIWCHTHPGCCPEPSAVDEETFARAFGDCQYAVMFILAEDDRTYARLRFNVGPGGDVMIPVEVDFTRPFEAGDPEAWKTEYAANVQPQHGPLWFGGVSPDEDEDFGASRCLDEDLLDQLAEMDPGERQYLLAQFDCDPGELTYEYQDEVI